MYNTVKYFYFMAYNSALNGGYGKINYDDLMFRMYNYNIHLNKIYSTKQYTGDILNTPANKIINKYNDKR